MVIQLIHFWPTELFQNKSSLGKYVIRGHLPIVLANGKFVNTAFSLIDQVGYIYIYISWDASFFQKLVIESLWLVCVEEVSASI